MGNDRPSFEEVFPLHRSKMEVAGVPEVAIHAFEEHFRRFACGEDGMLPEQQLQPVEDLPRLEELDPRFEAVGAEALVRTVVVRLNGGLGTTMGLEFPKSLLKVKDGLTFLDLIARQSRNTECPLLLMNSYATEAATRAHLDRMPEGGSEVRTFVQHQVPRIQAEDWRPASYPGQPELEWCPPGHGDIYHALHTSSLLDDLLAEGRRYAFVANADNLGAQLNLRLMGWFVESEIPFLMEVTRRTAGDAKGGHLARLGGGDGRLVLRESAQCPPEDQDRFQDIRRHRYFNTNNLWLDLAFLRNAITRDGCLKLPLIRNRKPLLPWDPDSRPVIQLESAMGSAITLFDGAEAIEVPRRRFAPVKTCSDLLLVRSDAVVLEPSGRLVPNPDRRLSDPPVVHLDPAHFRTVPDLEQRFPEGPPSLLHCRRFRVEGDVRFTRAPACFGDVHIVNPSPVQASVTATRIEGGMQCAVE